MSATRSTAIYKVTIKPLWELETRDGRRLPARLIELLLSIHETGSLAAASRRIGLSYRYAWGLLKDADAIFGVPLLSSTRGQGARLSAMGERLVRADNRIAARLSPAFDSLAAELEAELERSSPDHAVPLRLHASHGFGVETLRRTMSSADRAVDLKYRSPDDALSALRAGACDLAGLHVPLGDLEADVLRHYLDRLDVAHDRIVHLAMRRQGLVVAPGNPKRIRALSDLLRDDVRFIHRQPGSGTRLLLECMLARHGAQFSAIHGCDVEELTHAAVAAYVASGFADVGLALEPPARRYGLDFVPMVTEHYFFVCTEENLQSGRLAGLLDLLRDDAFRAELSLLPGYDPSYCGTVQMLGQAFPGLAAMSTSA